MCCVPFIIYNFFLSLSFIPIPTNGVLLKFPNSNYISVINNCFFHAIRAKIDV